MTRFEEDLAIKHVQYLIAMKKQNVLAKALDNRFKAEITASEMRCEAHKEMFDKRAKIKEQKATLYERSRMAMRAEDAELFDSIMADIDRLTKEEETNSRKYDETMISIKQELSNKIREINVEENNALADINKERDELIREIKNKRAKQR